MTLRTLGTNVAALNNAIGLRVGPTRIDVTGTATAMTTAGIQAVIDAAPAGAEFYFRRQGGGDGSLTFDAHPLVPKAAGQKFVHERGLTINQPNLYVPVYDILDVDDVTVHDLTAVGPSTRPLSGTGFRGSNTANYQAAVWTNSNRTRVTGQTRTTNFKIGVNFTAWDTATAAYKTKAHVDNYLEELIAIGADFGVLFYGQRRLVIDTLVVLNNIDSSAGTDPTHAIYGGGRAVVDGDIRNENVVIGKMISESNPAGCAFQFKYTDGLTVESGLASKQGLLLNLQDCSAYDIGRLVLRDTDPASWDGASAMVLGQTSLSPRGRIGSILIDDTGDFLTAHNVNAVNFSADNFDIGSLVVVTHRASSSVNYDVILSGTKGRVQSLQTLALGAAAKSLEIGKDSLAAVNISIHTHETYNAAQAVDINTGSTGVVYRYSPASHRSPTFSGSGIGVIGTGAAPTYTVESLAGKSGPRVTVFDSSGTWTPDASAVLCEVEVIGGGPGGSAGATAAANVAAAGGPGGGGGARARGVFALADIGTGARAVTVGAAGVGGTGFTTTSHSPTGTSELGTDGGTSAVNGLVRASGGGAPTSGTAGGAAGSPAMFTGGGGGGTSAAGGAGTTGSSSGGGAGGGGGGGGLTTGNTPTNGGGGGVDAVTMSGTGSAGGVAVAGSAGANGATAVDPSPANAAAGGASGGGGAASDTAGGGNGANGAGPGAAGGGGGAARNGQKSGNGGNGAKGRVVIREFY